LLREKSPDIWPLIWMQMSHLAKRKKSKYWCEKTNKIIEALKATIGLQEEDIPTITAILGRIAIQF
jgi:hypothetical protein